LGIQRDETVRRKSVAPPDKQFQKPRQVRHVTDQHDVASVAGYNISDPFGRIIWLQPARGTKVGKGITRTPEELRGLARTELPAVPNHRGLDAPVLLRATGKLFRVVPTRVRERPLGIDDRIDRIRVVNQEQHLSPEF
jgi:hypothetical protein